MRVFSFDRHIFCMKFPTGFTCRNLHGFTRFPGDSTAPVLLAHDSIILNALYAIACPSVCLSVTQVDQSKAVEDRIVPFSPNSSPISLFFGGISFIQKFWRFPLGRQTRGWREQAIFSFIRENLESDTRYVQSYNWWLIGNCILCAFDCHQGRWPWMTLNCYICISSNFLRTSVDFLQIWEATTTKRINRPYFQRQN